MGSSAGCCQLSLSINGEEFLEELCYNQRVKTESGVCFSFDLLWVCPQRMRLSCITVGPLYLC
jgi:hypothetical protein